MAIFPVYELTVFDDDDTAELFDVSTDPAHARPFLKAPTAFPEQEVNFAKGTASIGQMNLQIVDVPTDPTDQDTGYFTAQLAGAAGYSTLNGHRANVTEDLGGGPITIFDGVIRSVRLLDTFATYELELRDIRERERKAKAFENTDTPTVLPRGVFDGYGMVPPAHIAPFTYPVRATQPLIANYTQLSATRGEFIYELDQPNYQSRQNLTDPVEDAFDSIETLAAQPEVLFHNRIKVLWRDFVTKGAYTELTQIAYRHPDLPEGGGLPVYLIDTELDESSLVTHIFGIRVNNEVTADTLPASAQRVDVIVRYDGPPTDDWRHHLQGLTAGELLRNLYRGDYSVEDPRIRYDEAALLLLATPVRGRLKEPIDDVRAWAEKNVYPIVHAAPTLNADGEIAPITYLLPDEDETLTDLNNTNCRPKGAGWSQGSEDAINIVKVTYKREYRYNPVVRTAKPRGTATSDLLIERDIEIERRIQDSIDLLGEQPLVIDSVLLATIGNTEGGPYSGDTSDEIGHQVAQRVLHMATDRFSLGGQYFSLLGDRSVAAVEALKQGSWVTFSVSWMPDYGTGERNANRLAQVIGRRDRDSAWTHFTLLDAGTVNAPLAPPTLGVISATAAGVVSIPIATVPAGAECRLDYALSVLEPVSTSELWTFLFRAGVSTVTTTPIPTGATIWIRARSEAAGRRPSAYITAVSHTVGTLARILDAHVELDTDGTPRVYWVGNAATLGVRIHYVRHLVQFTQPTFVLSVDHDVDDDDVILSLIHPTTLGYRFSVELEPYPGWTGSAVSGSAGPRYPINVDGSLDLEALPTLGKLPPFADLEWYGPFDEGSGDTLRDRSGNVRDAAPESVSPAVIAWVDGIMGRAIDFPGSGKGYVLLTDAQADAIENLFYASCWIRVDDVAGDAAGRVIGRDASDYFSIKLAQNTAFPQSINFNYSDTQVINLADVIETAGVFYFLLAQFDQTLNIVEFWIGSEATGLLERVFRSESLAAFSSNVRPIVIGSETTTAPVATGPFDGSIDEVRVGAPAALLTHVEVLSLFRQPNPVAPTGNVEPSWEVEFDRDAQGNATLTLIIDDPSNAIVSPGPQFSKRAGSQSGDVWGSLSAVWDTEPTNPPYAGTWIEALTVPGGEESGIRWIYSWVDQDGVTRTHGHTHYTARIDENQVELVFSADQGAPASSGTSWSLGPGGLLTPAAPNTTCSWIIAITLPLGVVIEEFEARLYRDATHDVATCDLIEGDIDGSPTTLAALVGATGGWSTQVNTAVSQAVVADRSYQASIALRGIDVASDARIHFVRVVYDRLTFLQVY